MAKESCVKIQVVPLERGEDFEHEDSLVIFDADSPNQHSYDTSMGSPSHGDNTDLDEEDPKKRPKWWHNTIRDVWVGEMIEGQSLRGERKQKPNIVNFALIANV
jgi:hypothetical protein